MQSCHMETAEQWITSLLGTNVFFLLCDTPNEDVSVLNLNFTTISGVRN